jgi:ribosomal protein L35AE/L33A
LCWREGFVAVGQVLEQYGNFGAMARRLAGDLEGQA